MGVGGPVNDASSPLLRVIIGSTREVKASRSVVDGVIFGRLFQWKF
jgi:hypothetical protein